MPRTVNGTGQPDPRAVLARLVALRPRRGRDAVVSARNRREDQGENEGKRHEKLDYDRVSEALSIVEMVGSIVGMNMECR